MVEFLNHTAAMVAASLVNTVAVTCIGVGLALLLSRHKQWSASSRYCLSWIMLVFVIAAPFASALMRGKPHVRVAPPSSLHAVIIQSAMPESGLSMAAILLLCWAAASGFQFVVLARGVVYALRLKRQAKPGNFSLAKYFMRRPVSFGISDEITVPAVVGYWRPMVIIPASLEASLSATELEQVVLHELAHVARFDDWGIALQRLIEALGVWHPLVRYLGHRLSRDREMACDDQVTAHYDPKQYATCLAKVADIGFFVPVSALVVPLLERKSELLDRVEMLLDRTRTHVTRLSGGRLSVALAGLLLLGAAGLRLPRLMAMPVQAAPQLAKVSADDINARLEARLQAAKQHLADVGAVYLQSDDEYREAKREAEEVQAQYELIIDGQLNESTAKKMARTMQELKAKVDEMNAENPKNLSDAQNQLMELQARLAKMQAELSATDEQLGKRDALVKQLTDQLSRPESEKQLADLDAQMVQVAKLMAEYQSSQNQAEKRMEKQLNELIRRAEKRGLAQQSH